eukprot:8730726-Pyramimonas_sp.AAC.1
MGPEDRAAPPALSAMAGDPEPRFSAPRRGRCIADAAAHCGAILRHCRALPRSREGNVVKLI